MKYSRILIFVFIISCFISLVFILQNVRKDKEASWLLYDCSTLKNGLILWKNEFAKGNTNPVAMLNKMSGNVLFVNEDKIIDGCTNNVIFQMEAPRSRQFKKLLIDENGNIIGINKKDEYVLVTNTIQAPLIQ